MSGSSDSRTDTSSSTTNTTGVVGGIGAPLGVPPEALNECMSSLGVHVESGHSKGRIDRGSQGRRAERLEQAFHGTRLEHAGTDGFVSVSRDEDNRNRLLTARQFHLEARARSSPASRCPESGTSSDRRIPTRETLLQTKKSCAAKPNFLSRCGSDSRTDSSSSTTDTSDRDDHHTAPSTPVRSGDAGIGGSSILRARPRTGSRGIENANVAPGPSLACAQSRP